MDGTRRSVPDTRKDHWSELNDYGVIEMPFDPELLNCEDKLFHVRRCSQLCTRSFASPWGLGQTESRAAAED
jgi:hypothetical protein